MAEEEDAWQPLVLSVKANDFEMKIEGAQQSWTVAMVKQFVRQNHPLQPMESDQKLVYGGRVLNNNETLAALVPHGGRKTFLVHLGNTPVNTPVSSPTGASPTSSSSSMFRRGSDSALSSPQRRSSEGALRQGSHPGAQPHPSASGLHHRVHRRSSLSNIHLGQRTPSASSSVPRSPHTPLTPHTPNGSPYTPEQLAAYYAYYAQYYNTYGYSPSYHQYPQQQQYYYGGAASPVVSPVRGQAASSPVSPQGNVGHHQQAAPAAAAAAPAGRFAQAGHGAVPIVPPAAAQRQNNNGENGLLAIVGLIAKLVFLVALFGQHTTPVRFICLCCAAIIIFAYESGLVRYFQRDGGAPAAPADPAPAPAPAPVPAENPNEENNNINEPDAEVVRENNNEEEGQQQQTDAPVEQEPQTLGAEIRNVVIGFLSSLNPNHAYAMPN